MSNPIWQNQTVTLMQPLTRDNDSTANTLSLSMLSYQQHQQILVQHPDDTDAIYRALIKQGFGLTETELTRLVVPDYNALYLTVEEAYGQPSSHWFEKLGHTVDDSINQLTLLTPITTMDGAQTALTLQLPTVAALDLMNKQKDEDQSDFIRIHCTGLSKEELDQLSVPDWRALDAKVADFLSQTGSFFLARKN